LRGRRVLANVPLVWTTVGEREAEMSDATLMELEIVVVTGGASRTGQVGA
jgi:hypothetical protein